MSRFKKLFYEIVTEHAGLQVCIYFSLPVVMAVIGAAVTNNTIVDFMIFTVPLSVSIKLLSVVSSLIKAAIIIRGCNRGKQYFLDTYREWTGKYY